MIRALRITVSAVVSAVVIAWLIAACGNNSIPSDAGEHPYGWDPQVSECCDWFHRPFPWVDTPQVCLDERSANGECRWLECLGGIVRYDSSGCP